MDTTMRRRIPQKVGNFFTSKARASWNYLVAVIISRSSQYEDCATATRGMWSLYTCSAATRSPSCTNFVLPDIYGTCVTLWHFPVTKKVFDNLSSVHYLNCTRVLETQTCAGESCRFFRRNVLVQGLRLDPSVTPNRTGSSTWRREQRQSSKHIEFVFYIRNDGSCPEIQQWEIVYSCDGLNTQRNVIILITVLPKLMYYLAWTIISSNS